MPAVDVVVEFVVENACAALEETVRSGGSPAHLLLLAHPSRDDLIDRALGRVSGADVRYHPTIVPPMRGLTS